MLAGLPVAATCSVTWGRETHTKDGSEEKAEKGSLDLQESNCHTSPDLSSLDFLSQERKINLSLGYTTIVVCFVLVDIFEHNPSLINKCFFPKDNFCLELSTFYT